MIHIEGVRWTYAGATTPSLDDLTLDVQRGETVVLCGPSGSGKSSALRLMNGLVPHFHEGRLDGSVHLDGRAVADLSLDQLGRLTGTVLQHPRRQFFTGRSETELAFAMENFGEPPEQIRERVAAGIDEHGLTGFAGRRLQDLSGGQQQQVACAAAATHRPPVLLFDEPTSNLSAAAIERFTATLARLRADRATVVIAEHRLHFLRGLADRVVVLRDGAVHRQWSGEQFSTLDDDALRAEGLRSSVPPPRPKPLRAQGLGPSIDHDTTSMTASGTGVTLHAVSCAFHGRRVLDIETAYLAAGVVTAITGPNGAGKSTLARILTGLQRHQGEILLDGRRFTRSQRQRAGSIVMQDVQRQLFTDTVEAELRLGASRDAGQEQRLQALLRDLDLDPVRDRHPLSLSGGQQQRLVVAAARLSGRRIVVFDEPSSGVDRRHLHSITRVMRDLAGEGAVVILITHDSELLTHTADQELRLRPISP
ncbi:energy-coupling factor ABC transporter ATP-binding protein [Kribbella capetownensis]|uniref:Energy-coupling factor ABC transporter ATP-binding protein n=1 Tax=Kribbella capetownensis TaxID=1572659 RepID=A0A4R0JWR1_9ACTN|nr:energy-coupling factor ABC transporter ATP-binding protein [Kribbella capetownensis]TCC50654.1 energy-coupling factor ABC transporter ATP-binding protein [Kribbella capetownensis]